MDLTRAHSLSDLNETTTDVTLFVEMPSDVRGQLQGYKPADGNDDTAEFLKQVFRYLPSDGKSHLADDLLQCHSDDNIRQLAQNIESGLLVPIKAAGAKTATITPSPRIGLEESIENLGSTIDSSMVRKQKELRERCSRRDGDMCVISGVFDSDKDAPPGKETADLEAAHIIPFCLASFKDPAEQRYITSVWNTMYRYFPGIRSRIAFEYQSIDEARNAMMLVSIIHRQFGKFNIALEATGVPSQYRVKTFPRLPTTIRWYLPKNGIVNLITHDGREELPSPLLLQVHAAIANILHATGRAEAINKALQDYDDISVLARSGATNIARLLAVSRLPSLAIASPNANRPSKT
ncbi:hypothetical protein ASPZODRAFT_160560 [Penicilliopsis zonata CBS 506.65]|uniref:HNH nuclease domain-containing protein n=1 Tax=Penicilliopsis zonata CBS 506.65 TaxID=1073090 RepID=A0A1L9SDA3_9EURO|nr:hypothetical protein ASPZODRAFT_160560 [Penicilliopsis zonata CBS 506.65]OJJ45074.1 hypothetical protein ASPZODRAFT_160560 [Penicilliopsis zonata CBS 506.65]